jgi:hypothetical protein
MPSLRAKNVPRVEGGDYDSDATTMDVEYSIVCILAAIPLAQ